MLERTERNGEIIMKEIVLLVGTTKETIKL
jgi:hypothetical protein